MRIHPVDSRHVELPQHPAVGIDEIGFRIHERAVILMNLRVPRRQECGPELLQKPLIRAEVLIHANAQYDHSLVGEFLCKRIE